MDSSLKIWGFLLSAILFGGCLGVSVGLKWNPRARPDPNPIPGIDTNCCRDKINSGIYMVNLLRELKTNNVEIDRWEPKGTNWSLSIQQSVRNSNRMFIKYTE